MFGAARQRKDSLFCDPGRDGKASAPHGHFFVFAVLVDRDGVRLFLALYEEKDGFVVGLNRNGRVAARAGHEEIRLDREPHGRTSPDRAESFGFKTNLSFVVRKKRTKLAEFRHREAPLKMGAAAREFKDVDRIHRSCPNVCPDDHRPKRA